MEWIYREESGYDERFKADDEQAAVTHGEHLLATGDYGQGVFESGRKTFRVRGWVSRVVAEGDDDAERHYCGDAWLAETVALEHEFEPVPPPCRDAAAEHDWREPHELVGGLAENPGVFGSGGGVRIESACVRCGAGRTWDQWDHDPATGEVMETTSYQPGGTYALAGEDARP